MKSLSSSAMHAARKGRRGATVGLGIILALVGACAAPEEGRAPEAPAAGVVSLAALPKGHRELWSAWLAAAEGATGRAAWEEARRAALADPALGAFLVDNLLRQLVRAWDRSQLASTGHLPGPFERARGELVRLGSPAVPTLVELMAMADGSVALLAADTLAEIGAPSLLPTAVLLEREARASRRRAVELLGRLPAADDEVAIVAALGRRLVRDDEWVVRAQAARAIGLRGGFSRERGAARSVLVRGLTDPETNVRRECAGALAALGDPRVIPALIDALGRAVASGQPGELPALRAALKGLSGGREFTSLAAWRGWWSAAGAERVRAAG